MQKNPRGHGLEMVDPFDHMPGRGLITNLFKKLFGGLLGGIAKAGGKGVINAIPKGKVANHLFKGTNKLADNPANRRLITEISNGKALGVDAYGKSWYARTMSDGTQIYTYTQNGVVKGAGLNQTAVDIVKRYNLK